MSRNFELLQRAERESGTVPFSGSVLQSAAAVTAPATSVDATPVDTVAEFPEPGGSRLNLKAGIPKAEIEKLVQRLFLAQSASEAECARVVVFTSIDPGDGTTSICSVAADVLSHHTAASVCVVDARDHSNNAALRDCWERANVPQLRGADSIINCCTPITANLSVLSLGAHVGRQDQFRHADALRVRSRELRARFEYVLIDAPPLVESSESLLLGHIADGVVLVLRANSTRKEATRKVVADFETAGVRVLGVVLNHRRFPIPNALYPYL
jgi:Mrp family chromosome partitioning ATPase